MADPKEDLKALKLRLGGLAKAAPDVAKGFGALSVAATKAGTFSSAQKELVATAIAVTKGCEGCILYHVDAAKRGGATREELLELLGVAVEMGGGPSMVYAGKALEVFDGLS
ncbi:MAG: carboxymuconolactone decarboxylase family protein [Pseudomonadota bacterium]